MWKSNKNIHLFWQCISFKVKCALHFYRTRFVILSSGLNVDFWLRSLIPNCFVSHFLLLVIFHGSLFINDNYFTMLSSMKFLSVNSEQFRLVLFVHFRFPLNHSQISTLTFLLLRNKAYLTHANWYANVPIPVHSSIIRRIALTFRAQIWRGIFCYWIEVQELSDAMYTRVH